MSEPVLLSTYILTKKSKGKSIHPVKMDKFIQNTLMDSGNEFFGQIIPVKNYYTIHNGKIINNNSRLDATSYRSNNPESTSHRDYLIFDTEGFEAILDSEEYHRAIYNARSGKSSSVTPFKDIEEAATYSEEARKALIEQMKQGIKDKPKRIMSDEHKAKIKAAREKSRKENSKSTKSK